MNSFKPLRALGLIIALSSLAVSFCATAAPSKKPAVVLVHGAWEQADVWQGVVPVLRKDGYRVVIVTLPGRPSAPLSPDKVSLDLFRDSVLKAIAGERRPVVIVGHSFAGFTISNVAEASPEKVKTLVYVAAYLPKDGQSLIELGTSDTDSKVGLFLQIEKEQGIAVIDRKGRADLFCNDCDAGHRGAIPDLIVDEPLAPLVTPVHLTPERFGKADKVYIHTAKDQVVSPALQAKMVSVTPVRNEMTIDSGHTPFLTHTAELVKDIEAAAR